MGKIMKQNNFYDFTLFLHEACQSAEAGVSLLQYSVIASLLPIKTCTLTFTYLCFMGPSLLIWLLGSKYSVLQF